MKTNTVLFLILAGTVALTVSTVHAKQRAEAIMADEGPPEPPDPKKKKVGEECTSDAECQKHHSCKKTGDNGKCTAPPRPKLPPGVVT